MITLEQVRTEIVEICERDPSRTGRMKQGYGYKCVYFVDDEFRPLETPANPIDLRKMQPFCLVGTWISERHPELMNDPLVHNRLLANEGWDYGATEQLSPEANLFLVWAQGCQDTGEPWGSIAESARTWEPDPDDLADYQKIMS